MPGPMSRPDGHKESANERKARGQALLRGQTPRTGKTAK
jgi:hypothetical protein